MLIPGFRARFRGDELSLTGLKSAESGTYRLVSDRNRVQEYKEGWQYGYKDRWIHGYKDPWIHGSMDTRIHEFMDQWIHG